MAVSTAWEVQALHRLCELMTRASGEERLEDLFRLIVDDAADVVGFQVAALSVVQANGDLRVVAVAGHPDAEAKLVGRVTPRTSVEAEFAAAERWGNLRFVPHERLPESSAPGWVVSDWRQGTSNVGAAEEWHPLDTLLAPFHSPTGQLLGMLSVDLPLTGRRPTELERGLLEVFASQAGVAINHAQQRDALAERMRLSEAVQEVARISGGVLDAAPLVEAVVDPIAAGLRCSALWVRVLPGHTAPGDGFAATRSSQPAPAASSGLVAVARRLAEWAWQRKTTVLLAPAIPRPDHVLSEDEVRQLMDFIACTGSHSLVLTPIGAGTECLGYLIGTRADEHPTWTEAEIGAAVEIGRDLGRAVLNARLFALERQLVADLQRADRDKTNLFATVSHELKNPLASIVGHLELIATEPDADNAWSLQVMERNTARLQALVDDLLTLARVSDPDRQLVSAPVRLSDLADEVVDMFAPQAVKQNVTLEVDCQEDAVVNGNREELSRLLSNLVSNAVKYSPHGGTVCVRARVDDGDVVVECSDQGLGISAADQSQLFNEFFRSTNPEALRIPGTGLGLSIAARIAARHRGRIGVQSSPGAGTTFSVTLPRHRGGGWEA